MIERDTVILNDNKERVQLKLKAMCTPDTYTWIQGIGNIGFNVFAQEENCRIDQGGPFYCFYTNDELIFMNPWYSDCDITPTIDIILANLTIYPNPATDLLTIDSPDENLDGYTLQMSNILGERVLRKSLQDYKNTLDIASLERGIYLYQIFSAEGKLMKTGKVVKE